MRNLLAEGGEAMIMDRRGSPTCKLMDNAAGLD
jgi:hypothetical protein